MIGFEFATGARRQSIAQMMDEPANPNDPAQLIAYLKANPYDVASIIWTLRIENTPLFAIMIAGPFGQQIGERLLQFLSEQVSEGVERVSLAGTVQGEVTLQNGLRLPLVLPSLRGMYSWHTQGLVEAVCGKAPGSKASDDEKTAFQKRVEAMHGFLERSYEEFRSRGLTPADRALNYAATNAFITNQVFLDAINQGLELIDVMVTPSPIASPGSDVWDVNLIFMNPHDTIGEAKRVYRVAVDVTDVVPVMHGRYRLRYAR